jgi:metallo-beta-lactamase class B
VNRLFPILLALGALSACGPKPIEPDAAHICPRCDDWNEPQDPFRLYGNTWYVGTAGLSSILIEANEDLILLDGGLTQSAALIDSNIRKLGFDPLRIKAILLSHPHFDHAGGVAAIQRLTGAVVHTSAEGEKTLGSGHIPRDDPTFVVGGESPSFPAVKNVVAVGNGEIVTIGGVDIKAVYTPGHTPGGVTWTWESCALGNCLDVVYADSLTAVSSEGYRFSDGPAADQLIESAGAISDLDCDILLSPHPFFFGMQNKLEKREDGNPFVNNVACMIYAESSLDWLEQRLAAER